MAEARPDSDLVVCRVEPAEWCTHRDVRLAMLLDTPAAFASTYAREAVLTDVQWRDRVRLSRTFHARLGDRPVGSVTCYRGPGQPEDEAYLVALWVSASARGRGVGDALVSVLVDDARDRGLSRLLLDVADGNSSAIGLYERMGFTATGRTSTLAWDPSVTEFEMECLLDPLSHGADTRHARRDTSPPCAPAHSLPLDGRVARPPAYSWAMSEITVRALTEDDWEQYRSIRLAALEESPGAFVATHAEEQAYDEDHWRLRMRRSMRLLAEAAGRPVGVASLGDSPDAPNVAQLFGLWVAPSSRGTGVATRLVSEGAAQARELGKSHLTYWVGTDNGRAVAFASGFGFRPTDDRRPMRVKSDADGEEEIAMVLPLGEDRI